MKYVLSTCGGCGSGCGILLYEESGRIKGVSPVRIHPTSKGNLCFKGWNIYQSVNSNERIKKPLLKKNGTFKEVTWEVAIDSVVRGLKKVLEKEGGKGIGVIGSQNITNEENYMLMKFARSVLRTNNIDNCGVFQCFSIQNQPYNVFYEGSIYSSIEKLKENDIILLIGSEIAKENPIIGTRVLQAIRRGAEIYLINPRKVQYGLFSNVYLQNMPGSEVSILNGILRLILEDRKREKKLYDSLNLYNQDFIEGVSGIDYEDLKKIAEGLKKKVRKLIIFSSGLVRSEFLSHAINGILNIAKFTGSKVYSLGGQNNFRGAVEMGIQPNTLTDYRLINDTKVKKGFEKVWRRTIPNRAGLNVYEMLDEALKFNLRCMYVVGEDIAVSAPDINRTRNALSNLDFLVVQDMFMTETAKFADVVLPAASFAEKEGTFTNLEGRVQRVRKIIEPRFESKSDLEIISLLEKGFRKRPRPISPPEIMKEIASLTPHYKGISYDKLDKEFGKIVNFPLDGKISETYPVEKRYLKTPESPNVEYPYYLISDRTSFCHNSATLSKYSDILGRELSKGEVELNPKDARELNFRAGQLAKIISKNGELTLPVKLNPDILVGTVFIPLHFRTGNSNELIGSKNDTKLKIAGWMSCIVRVEKA